MGQAIDIMNTYPETPYLFEVNTMIGPGAIRIDETQWDVPAKITIEDYGLNGVALCIRDFFQKYGFGMEGKFISLKAASPVDIDRALALYFEKEDAPIKGFKIIWGFVPEESPDDDPSLDDSAGIFESALAFKEKKFKLQDSYQFQGLPISIENKKGSYRRGVDPGGHEWKIRMSFDYGYIRKTKGADDEGVDVYVGPDRSANHVYIVKQHKIEMIKKWEGEYCPDCNEHVHDCACPKYFDEDKVFIGFPNKKAVVEAYGKQYDSPLFMGPISTMTIEKFRSIVCGPKEEVKIPLQFVGESCKQQKEN